MIEVKRITKTFSISENPLTVLKELSFTIKSNEFISITGKSGSGKSTLLYQLGLLDIPSSGTVIIDNIDTASLTENQRTAFRLANFGYVFQDYALLPVLTAIENVVLPLYMQGYDNDLAIKKATDALIQVGLQNRLHNLPNQMSGGEQQRVSIARAISHNPKIIFADEPTANLDTESSHMVLETFLTLHKSGQTVVMVTHEPDYAAMADRTITLSDGKIIADKKTRRK